MFFLQEYSCVCVCVCVFGMDQWGGNIKLMFADENFFQLFHYFIYRAAPQGTCSGLWCSCGYYFLCMLWLLWVFVGICHFHGTAPYWFRWIRCFLVLSNTQKFLNSTYSSSQQRKKGIVLNCLYTSMRM